MLALRLGTAFMTCMALAHSQINAPPRRPESRRQPAEQRDARQIENLKTELKLDAGQLAKWQSVLDDARRDGAALEEELRLGRVKLLAALREGKSEAEIGKLTAAQGEVYSRMAANEAWAVAKIFGLMNDEQKKQAEAAFAGMQNVVGHRPPAVPGRVR